MKALAEPCARRPQSKRWDQTFFRLAILDDAYRPHTHDEVAERVAPEIAACLDRDGLYGLWTYNRVHTRTRQVSEPTGDGGRRYRRQVRTRERLAEERLHVPVPYSGVTREIVEAAREAIKDNRRPSNSGRRFWQLSGGIMRCGVCGMGMESHSVRARSDDYYYHYYHCRKHYKRGGDACAHKRSHRAADVEGAVWDLVAGLLRDPERLRIGLDTMIEAERAGSRGDPDQEARSWLDRLAALDRKRGRYQEMAAEGLTFEELGAKLRETDEARATAERELAEVEGRCGRIEQLERDRDAIMEHYAGMVPEALDDLTGQERYQIYRMTRLRATVHPDGGLDVEGVLREPVCTPTGTP